MWIFSKVFIEFVIVSFLFYVLGFGPPDRWDPSSPSRDGTGNAAPALEAHRISTPEPPGMSDRVLKTRH